MSRADPMPFDDERWGIDDEQADALDRAGEHFAAGLLHTPSRGDRLTWAMRHARGIERHLSRCALWPYSGEALYPAGGSIWAPRRHILNDPGLPEPVLNLTPYYVGLDLCLPPIGPRSPISPISPSHPEAAFERLARFCAEVPRGGGYTHSIINYERALAEGLELYAARVRRLCAETDDAERRDLYEALLVALDAIRTYCARMADLIESSPVADPRGESNRLRILGALRAGIPFRAAETFFEAMLAVTILYALDGSDNLGRFDQYMRPYYERALETGEMGRDEAIALIGCLWRYVDACSGWNVALGGTTRSGEPAYSDLTVACLEAARGMRRPNLALRLRRDTPDIVWDAALDTIASGAGMPALYGEENYLRAIAHAHLNISDEDRRDFAFGGCTELMVQGCSNVGSLDGDFSAIKALEETLRNGLVRCETFEDLLHAYEADLADRISDLTQQVSRNQSVRASCHPQLIRTLLIDDCVDRGREYYYGGARCNWSVINVVGLSNVVDALAAVRRVIYDERLTDAETLLEALRSDFEGHGRLLAHLNTSPRFGNDDSRADAIALRLSRFIYREFQRYAPWRGGRILCGTLMFVTYGWFGRPVGATPDGRRAGAPVADSAGPVQGRDRSGPTAMLRSVACLAQEDAPGTLVVNLRLMPELLRSRGGRERVRAMIRSYFDLGGMQLQINVVDQSTLEDAILHPERHADLIVRVGGYSEYFNRLDEDLKRTVLERTAHD